MEIQRNPVNAKGEKVTPVVWESGCLEEVCGSCSMLVNGRPRQACSALILNLLNQTESQEIILAPLTKFPLIRDLIVDRSSMFENLKKVHAWIDADTQKTEGYGPKIKPEQQQLLYTLSTCMTCGCCLEGCPQVNQRSSFMGPAVVSQVRLFNQQPAGKKEASMRLEVMMQEGGVAGCGKSMNCKEICPKKIPLTDSIAEINRSATLQTFKKIFG